MAFTSSYTEGLIQQSEYYYGVPSMEPGLSGSFSGSFQGDGSQLTGVGGSGDTPTFIGSGSTSASTDPNNGVVINASGSTLFDVRGSLGSLFSVTDSFEDNLFEVNNISGISLLTVSSSGDVDIPKGVLTVSGSVSASQFLGDGSQLTGISSTPFPFTGDAKITGSLTISGSFSSFRVAESNIVLGTGAGALLRSSDTNNVMLGVDAGAGVQNDDVIAIGHSAGGVVNFNSSVVIGKQAGLNVQGSANSMVLIGELAGQRADTGDTYIGTNSGTGAGSGGSSGGMNTGLGYLSLSGINGGSNNIGIGRNAGASIASGDGNIIIGSGSLGEAAMSNQLRIGNSNNFTLISGSLADGGLLIQGQVSASSYIGDGSGLTGISSTPFPFTGDAKITGSLVISASNNTSESLSIQGSGSTIFSIQGSQGQLFSVTDDLLDEVFSVADISGDTLLSVSGSGLVTIPVGDLTGSATATASYGAFKGDGSQLTNLPASNPFPFTGDASITGSLTVSGSFHAFRLNSQNVVLGQDAGFNTNVNGPRNVFVGYQAAYTNTIGDDNVCVGRAAGYALSNGASDGNIFIGSLAGAGGTSPAARMSDANNNIGIGYEALLYLTSGDQNIGMGVRTLRHISTGRYNYAYGDGALYNTNSGQNNIGIGYQAGLNQTTGNGNITIGSGSLGVAGESNQLRIGNGNGDVLIHGDFDSGSITFNVSGSNAFQVIGTEGTIFKLDDDLDGTLFTVNDRSGIPMFEVSASGRIVAEEGESIIRSQRPMVTHTADFSITSSLDFAGKYHIVGGDLTCSINTSSIVPAGAEFEFFQTSSAGNFLYTTASHVDLIVKNDNLNLAGRGSGATLKYIGGSTFHLVGDLT
tara:strand:+ start:6661 stop:9252 length:2592 start_codon:yes stop_codon:yes gene_type:complete